VADDRAERCAAATLFTALDPQPALEVAEQHLRDAAVFDGSS